MRLLMIVMALALCGCGVQAAEYFAKSTGDDTAAGTTTETAWKTIQRAVKDLKPGDVLTIAPGHYEESVTVTVSGEEGKPILIRAERPGFTVLTAGKRLGGFEKAPGMRFVSAVKVAQKIYNVCEADTHRMLLRAPNSTDLDQFRNAYFYDDALQTLYVHSSDGQPASAHSIEVTIRPGFGMVLSKVKYVHVEGLVLKSHYIDQRSGSGFGMAMQTAEHCEVRKCTFLNNAGGITFNYNSANNTVRDCLFIGNDDPLYGELAQMYVSAGSDHISAIDNVVLDAPTHGIRFYNNAANSTAIGNIVKNARIGLYYKATKGDRRAERNVVVGCSYYDFNSGENPGPFECHFNTFGPNSVYTEQNLKKPDGTDLIIARDVDPKFCDPDHLDYRLQSDSPYRGKAPGGKDLGAYQYEANVFFVSPAGDDANDGLCAAKPFKTLKKACSKLRPGTTVYLLPGEYPEALQLEASGTKDKPIVFRSRGKGMGATVVAPAGAAAACDLRKSAWVNIEDISFVGGQSAIMIGGNDVCITRCAATRGQAAALEASGSNISVSFCFLHQPRGCAAKLPGTARNFSITSSVLVGGEAPVVAMGQRKPDDVFFEYNAYWSTTNGALIHAADKAYERLDEWRQASGFDKFSRNADPRLSADSRALSSGSPLIGAGQFGQHMGPYQVAHEGAKERIEDVRVREATPTTASITYWTPGTSSALWRSTTGWWGGIPRLAKVCYGVTPECKDGALESLGDLYHRDTLFDLKPGTKYYYRVELTRNAEVVTPVGEFTTPSVVDWKPARRTLYVAPAGDDANDGLSKEKAFRTLQKASEEARAGDTVVVADGVYRETIAPVATGVAGAPITFFSETLNGAVLDGSNYHRPSAVLLATKGDVIIDGFVMRQFAPKNLGRRAAMEYAQVVCWGARNITVRNCVQWGFGNYGMAGVIMGSDNIVLRNNAVIGFEAGWSGRPLNEKPNGRVELWNNTWYVPMIANLNISAASCAMKNNLFFGVEEQKYSGGLIGSVPTGKETDYNAYAFHANDPFRRISRNREGQKLADTKWPNGEGLPAWQEDTKADLHAIELKAEQVQFAAAPVVNTRDAAFWKFWTPYRNAEKTPTLALFDLPADGPLGKSGENGAPIGARSVRVK